MEQRHRDPSLWLLPLLSFPLLRLVQRDVTDVDVVFIEFQEGPVYTTGQSVSRDNTAKALVNLQAKAFSLPPHSGQNSYPNLPPLASFWLHVGKDPRDFHIPLLSHPLLLRLQQTLLLFLLLPHPPRHTTSE